MRRLQTNLGRLRFVRWYTKPSRTLLLSSMDQSAEASINIQDNPVQSESSSPSFYRRPLPDHLVAFSSPEGRKLFKEALHAGGMENYFALAEQFSTQSEPAFCGHSTLAMVLNTLAMDPGFTWKSPWRWYTEELLECCLSLETVKRRGMNLAEFAKHAQCRGALARYAHATDANNLPHPNHPNHPLDPKLRIPSDSISSIASPATSAAATAVHGPSEPDRGDGEDGEPYASVEQFRQDVRHSTHGHLNEHGETQYIVTSFDRKTCGQTGTGHFSPIGGYHAEKDLALILDVARFKYPPYWMPLPLLWEAMCSLDPTTKRARGYLVMSKSSPSSICPARDKLLHKLNVRLAKRREEEDKKKLLELAGKSC